VCHQTVSLVARHLEANGIATVTMASALDIVEAGRPPRAGFIDYPLGHTCGQPFDEDDQLDVVQRSLALLAQIPHGVVDLGKRWPKSGWRETAMKRDAGDAREVRHETPQYQLEADRIAAEHHAG